VHPVFVRIGGYDIAWYGLLTSMGVLVGVLVAIRRGKTVSLPPDLILDLAFYSVIIGFIGSRVFFILGDLRGFLAAPKDYIFTRQGYVFFGGLIVALAFAVWYLRRKRCDLWQVADVMAPSIALGHMFGRVGCFFSGCCYGRICPPGWEAWGWSFPKVTDPDTGEVMFSFAYISHVERGLIGPDARSSLPIFPVQLYEAAALFLIFLGLTWLWRRRRFRGQLFAAYLAAYGTVRFLVEFLRGDYDERILVGLLQRGQLSQIASLLALGVAVTLWWRLRHRPLGEAIRESPSVMPPETANTAPTNSTTSRSAAKTKRGRRR